jgi:hypothetical protein
VTKGPVSGETPTLLLPPKGIGDGQDGIAQKPGGWGAPPPEGANDAGTPAWRAKVRLTQVNIAPKTQAGGLPYISDAPSIQPGRETEAAQPKTTPAQQRVLPASHEGLPRPVPVFQRSLGVRGPTPLEIGRAGAILGAFSRAADLINLEHGARAAMKVLGLPKADERSERAARVYEYCFNVRYALSPWYRAPEAPDDKLQMQFAKKMAIAAWHDPELFEGAFPSSGSPRDRDPKALAKVKGLMDAAAAEVESGRTQTGPLPWLPAAGPETGDGRRIFPEGDPAPLTVGDPGLKPAAPHFLPFDPREPGYNLDDPAERELRNADFGQPLWYKQGRLDALRNGKLRIAATASGNGDRKPPPENGSRAADPGEPPPGRGVGAGPADGRNAGRSGAEEVSRGEPVAPGDVASLPQSVLAERRTALHVLGFSDQWIKAHPQALRNDTGNITSGIRSLRALRFTDPEKMIASVPDILDHVDTIGGKLDELRKAGFDDAVEIAEASPEILLHATVRLGQVAGIVAKLEDGRSTNIHTLIKKPQRVIDAVENAAPKTWAEISAVIARLRAGGAQEAADAEPSEEPAAESPEAPVSASPDNDGYTRAERIAGELGAAGVKNPVKLIISSPGVLRLPEGIIGRRIKGLSGHGFKNPVDVVTRAPNTLKLLTDTVGEKIEGLRRRGFTDPVKVFEEEPTLIYYDTDTISGRLDDLGDPMKMGPFVFADPLKLAADGPNVLKSDLDTLCIKLAELGRSGFDPVKIAEASPKILRYGPERLGQVARIVAKLDDRKITNIHTLLKKPQRVIDAVENAAPTTWAEVSFVIHGHARRKPGPAATIPEKLNELEKAGFDGATVAETSPEILKYAPERVGQAARIVAKLDDGQITDIYTLLRQSREVIDAVENAAPTTWEDVLNMINAARRAKRGKARPGDEQLE